jgi:hypothetical protein
VYQGVFEAIPFLSQKLTDFAKLRL